MGAGSAAAAGAAVGIAGTVGVGLLTEDKGDGAPGAPVAGMLGVPAGVAVADAVVTLNVNGRTHRISVDANESLAEVLRRKLGLTGTQIGCDRSECSACTVLVDGVAVNSCSLLAIREEGKKILTIEGLARGDQLSPVQEGFLENMGLQCGFCTPGQIMQATALLMANPKPSEAQIREELSGNLCKCSAYPNIIASVKWAAEHWKA